MGTKKDYNGVTCFVRVLDSGGVSSVPQPLFQLMLKETKWWQ